MRERNQGIVIAGSTQVTDEYPVSESFPNSHKATNYYEWCVAEVKRMGVGFFIVEDTIDIEGIPTDVCHIRKADRV